jgi:hypothetical protein
LRYIKAVKLCFQAFISDLQSLVSLSIVLFVYSLDMLHVSMNAREHVLLWFLLLPKREDFLVACCVISAPFLGSLYAVPVLAPFF